MLMTKMEDTLPLTVAPNLWKAWLLLQRADIWETRLQLARILCEASIRCSTLPDWSSNFWKLRQAYRFTTKTQKNTSDLEKRTSVTVSHIGESTSSSPILTEIRAKASERQSRGRYTVLKRCTVSRRHHDLAIVLLEVALQTSLYDDVEILLSHVKSDKDLKNHVTDLLALSKYAATIMGIQYSEVVAACLSNVTFYENPYTQTVYHIIQDGAMEKLHDPLQSMLESGFRASRGRVTSGRHRIKTIAFGSHAPETVSYGEVRHAASHMNYTSASAARYINERLRHANSHVN